MARKTMPAARKRISPSSEQQQQQHVMTLSASAEEEQEKNAASASAPASEDASGVQSLPCSTPLDGPSFHPPLSHAHGYKRRRAHGDFQSMRKWLHARRDIKRVFQSIEEMCKVLTMAGRAPRGNALASSYGSTCNLLFGANKSATIQDLIDSLTNFSTRGDNVWPKVNAEYCSSHCLNDVNCTHATERSGAFNRQNITQSKVLTNPKDICLLTSQFEIIKEALRESVSEMEDRSNLDMGLFGQHPDLSTLLNALLNSSHSSCKRKKSWEGNVSRKATNLVLPNRKGTFMGQKEYCIKSSNHDRVQTQSRLGVDKEKLANSDLWTAHQMSPVELENWIVKHSIPSKKREQEVVLKLEKMEKDCLELGGENHIEIEVDLSERDGFLLENEAAATDSISNMLYVKRIMKTISLNRVNLDGEDEVIVLFKALRSDGREVIVDNAYLRSAYPLLLATFYEQNLRFVVGKSLSGQMQCCGEENAIIDLY